MAGKAEMLKPRVVLDLAPLGWSWSHKQHARGIHRVAEKLVQGLIASEQCELSFVATSSVFASQRYLVECTALPSAPFHHRPPNIALSRWAYEVHRREAQAGPESRVCRRASRWVIQKAANQAAKLAVRLAARFNVQNLATADIYHSTLAPIPAAVGRSRLKRFLTVHDLIPLTHPETVWNQGVALLLRQLDSLTPGSFAFCVSNYVRHDLLNCTRLPPENVFVTPLAAAPETFYPVTDPAEVRAKLQRYGIPETPFFLTLSSFDPRKNFVHLIRCFGELAESGELGQCNLVLVGTNPEGHSCFEEAIAEFPKVKHRIITPGFIPDEDLAAIYSGAAAFAFPSLSEGFGIPAVEAMQCGLPLIASNTTSMPEVVGDAGVLLDPRDKDAWCAAMKQILRDAGLALELRKKSIARAKLFSWGRFIEETLRGYRQSLER